MPAAFEAISALEIAKVNLPGADDAVGSEDRECR
jgi:hypothetical protein